MTATLDAASFGVLRLPSQVLFGAGSSAAVPALVREHGTRVLVCTDATMATTPAFAELRRGLEAVGCRVEVFDRGVPELPLTVVDDAVGMASGRRPDVVVGFGGGSSMDLAKATAMVLAHGGAVPDYYGENRVPGPVVPVIAVPTTAGTGSEVTPVAVFSDPDRALKVGVSSPHLVPAYAVVDPTLTLGCPPTVSAHSGADALAHAFESLTARSGTPRWDETLPVFVGANQFSGTLALEAATQIVSSLGRAVHTPDDLDARSRMSYGSLCAAMSFGTGGTHLGHALQYAIGAATETSHGLGVGLLLPYVLELCRRSREEVLLSAADTLAVAPDANDQDRVTALIDQVHTICADIGLPRTLADLGVRREDLTGFVEQTDLGGRLAQNAPVPVDDGVLLSLLDAAWSGDRERVARP